MLCGCAATPPVPLPPGTLLLGEVMSVLTRPVVDSGELGPRQPKADLHAWLRDSGWTDSQLDQGRLVVVRYSIYWNNTLPGIHRDDLGLELLGEGVKVEPGNIVEIAVQRNATGIIERVRARSLGEGGCYYGDVPVGVGTEALGVLSLVGPRGSASLYCAGIEREGWQRPNTYWRRVPGEAAAAPGSSAVEPPVRIDP